MSKRVVCTRIYIFVASTAGRAMTWWACCRRKAGWKQWSRGLLVGCWFTMHGCLVSSWCGGSLRSGARVACLMNGEYTSSLCTFSNLAIQAYKRETDGILSRVKTWCILIYIYKQPSPTHYPFPNVPLPFVALAPAHTQTAKANMIGLILSTKKSAWICWNITHNVQCSITK